MKSALRILAIGAVSVLLLSGCFVSDANDDNPGNTVSPEGTLGSNFVLKFVIEDRELHTAPGSLDTYSKAYVILTNSDGSPVINVPVTITADDPSALLGYSQEAVPLTVVTSSFTAYTGTNGGASFYIWATSNAACMTASLNLVATAPYAVAYSGIGLDNTGCAQP